MKKILKPLILLTLICLIHSCDKRTKVDIYRDLLNEGTQGQVKSTELWKGGLLVIQLEESDGSESVAEVLNNTKVLTSIKRGDYFKKLPNSNKVILSRNDSIMLMDGINLVLLTDEVTDSLTPVDQWGRERINKWFAKTEIKDEQE